MEFRRRFPGSTVGVRLFALLSLGWLVGCSGPGPSQKDSGGPAPPAIITSFTANPPAIAWGKSSTLSWTVAGAQSLSIDFGIGPVSGASITVAPDDTTTYTLRAVNSSGNSTTATATVTLVRPATLTSSFFPLADGNHWTFDNGTSLTVSISEGSFVLDWWENGSRFYRIFLQASPDGLLQNKEEHWCDPTNYTLDLWEGAPNAVEKWNYWATPFRAWSWGMKVGDSETVNRDEEVTVPTGTDGVVQGGCATIHWTDWKYIHQMEDKQVVTAQKLTLPAGKFDALWIATYRSESNNPFNACGSSEGRHANYWLAEGVGLVQFQPDTNNPQVVRLVSYQVK